MSLGLDALNKLQRMQAEGAAAPTTPVARSPHHHRPQTNQLLVAAVIFGLGVGTAVLFCNRGHAPVAQGPAAPAPATVAAEAAPVPPPVMLAVSGSASPAPAPLQALPAAPAPAARIIISAAPAKAGAARLSTSAPARNPLITAFVARGVVGGVDAGGPDRKPVVMFNDAICHLNDVVNYALGVRLVAIQPNRLTFEDSRGVLYVRDLFPL